ncbi:hypothetical protein PG984_014132 [Apiospora sp. TS-2023a]
MKLWLAVRTHAHISTIAEEIKSNPSISLGKGDPDNRRLYLAQQLFINFACGYPYPDQNPAHATAQMLAGFMKEFTVMFKDAIASKKTPAKPNTETPAKPHSLSPSPREPLDPNREGGAENPIAIDSDSDNSDDEELQQRDKEQHKSQDRGYLKKQEHVPKTDIAVLIRTMTDEERKKLPNEKSAAASRNPGSSKNTNSNTRTAAAPLRDPPRAPAPVWTKNTQPDGMCHKHRLDCLVDTAMEFQRLHKDAYDQYCDRFQHDYGSCLSGLPLRYPTLSLVDLFGII